MTQKLINIDNIVLITIIHLKGLLYEMSKISTFTEIESTAVDDVWNDGQLRTGGCWKVMDKENEVSSESTEIVLMLIVVINTQF